MSWIAGLDAAARRACSRVGLRLVRAHASDRRACSRWSATLAALAALGRVAFAPLPNVKPTTDIVLIAGYALGGAPGFVVGAVAALASNLFFGQGPWTPWQMAAGAASGSSARCWRASPAATRRVPLGARLRDRRRSPSARS